AADFTAQLPIDARLVLGPAHVHLVAQTLEQIAFAADAIIGAGDQGTDVAHRLARLLAFVAGMCALVADNAGSAGDEQRGRRVILDAGAGEGRAARSVLRRVVPGAALARILQRDRRP